MPFKPFVIYIKIIRLRLCHDQPGRFTGSHATDKKRIAFEQSLEVWIGVEPTNRGFADRSLTAWVPHRVTVIYQIKITLSSVQVQNSVLITHFQLHVFLLLLKKKN